MNIIKKSIVLVAFIEGGSNALALSNLRYNNNDNMYAQLERSSHHHHKNNLKTSDNYDNDQDTVSRFDNMEIHKKFDWFPKA